MIRRERFGEDVNVRIVIVGPADHGVIEYERTAVQLVKQHDVVAVGERRC